MAWPRAWFVPRGAPGTFPAAAEFGLDLESLLGLVHTRLSVTCRAAPIFWAMSMSCQRRVGGHLKLLKAMTSPLFALKYLRIKFKVAAAVSKQVDLPLHLLVLIQSSLLLTVVVEEDGKVQVDQRISSGTNGHMRRFNSRTGFTCSTLKVRCVRRTHSSMVTACSYALVAFSTSSKLVRATVTNQGVSITTEICSFSIFHRKN